MHDRVAEVLAQRAALDRGPAPAVLLSLLLHGGATALAIYTALHQPPPQQATLVNIQFRSVPQPMTPAVSKPAPKKAEPRIEPPKPVPVTPPKPIPTTTTAPPPKNTVPTSAFGKSPKKGADVVPAPAPATPAPPTATVPDIAVGGSGVTGVEGGDFPYTIYIDRMQTIIGRHWVRPQQVAPGTETTIYFRIQRDGTIRDAIVETKSVNPTFDRAALRAILESSPLPPLPFAYNGTYLGVHLKFR